MFSKLLLLIFGILPLCYGWEVVVDPGREECFVQNGKNGDSIGIIYQVSEGGALDIDLRVQSPSGRLVKDDQRKTEGNINFLLSEPGLYTICFSNYFSTITAKTVNFDVLLQVDTEPNIPYPAQADVTNLDRLVQKVYDSSIVIQKEIDYALIREKTHRSTSEHINATVVWWNIFEILILLAMAGWQIFYLRRFFEVKRPI